jgi:Bacterial Ig domain
VTPVNDVPIAVTDPYTTAEDTPITLTPLTGDTDPDGNPLTVTSINGTALTGGAQTIAVPNGTVNITAGGVVSFTPASNFNGTVTIPYVISDGQGGTATANQVITVTPVNDAPTAVNDNYTMAEDGTAITLTPLTTGLDTDPENDTLTVNNINGTPIVTGTPVSIPVTGGTIAVDAAGLISFTPIPNFNGNVSVPYTITDGNGGTATANITINVTPVNDAPVANDDNNVGAEQTPITGKLLTNDTDPDGDPLKVTQFIVNGVTTTVPAGTTGVTTTIPAVGSLTVREDGSYSFTSVPNYNGAVPNITYTVTDGQQAITANLTINVSATNSAPLAVTDNYTTAEDTPVTLTPLTADTDPDADTLSITSINGTALTGGAQTIAVPNGTVNITAGGVVSFTPASNFNGTVTIPYVISDGNGGTATANQVITVTPLNDAPTAVNDNYTMPEDGSIAITPLITGADTDPEGNTLTVTSLNSTPLVSGTPTTVSVPEGVFNVDATGKINFTAAPDFNGTVTVPYTISDGNGGTATANILITITPVNDAPTAVDDNYTMPEDGTAITLTPLTTGLDTDPENDTLTVNNINGTSIVAGTPVSIPVTGGTIAVDAAGLISFTPTPNFNGTISVPYTITDGNGGTATANITINVTPVNDAPTAVDDNYTTAEDTPVTLTSLITGADSDPENNPLTVTSINGTPIVLGTPSNFAVTGGTVSVDAVGTLTFNPSANFVGNVTIPYQISDGNGGSATANILITVTPVNDAPTAVDDSYTMAEDGTAITLTPLTTGLDTDPENDTLTVNNINGTSIVAGTPVSIPVTGGTIAVDAAGLISFTPTPNFNGTISVPYTITDGNGGTATANITINVTPVNDAPVANIVPTTTIAEDTPSVPVNLGGTDVEDGIPNVVKVTTLPTPAQGLLTKADGTPVVAGATLTAAEAANLVFKPTTNFNGTVNIPFTVTDSSGLVSVPSSATIQVTAVNDLPIAVSDNYTTPEDTAVTLTPLAADTDPDGNPLTVTSINGTALTGGAQTIAVPNGTVNITAGGVISFTPTSNFNGTATIPYEISDGQGGTATANQVINVTPVNDPPSATPTSASGNEDTPVKVALIGTDTESPSSDLIVKIPVLPNPTQGVLQLPNGTPVKANEAIPAALAADLTFVPTANFNGTVTVPFTVTDPNGLTSSPANAVITIAPVNDPPVANTASISTILNTPVGVNLTGTDLEDGVITSVTVTTLPLASEGVLYMPDGNTPVALNSPISATDASSLIFKPTTGYFSSVTDLVVITFSVQDSQGASSTPVDYVIDVEQGNQAPTATPATFNTLEDTPLIVTLAGIDPDDTVTAVLVSSLPPAAQGTLYLSDGVTPVLAGVEYPPGAFVFVPSLNFNSPDGGGNVIIPFTVKDSVGQLSTPQNITITVLKVNDALIANPDSKVIAEDTTTTGNLLANDSDVDIDALLKVTQFEVAGTNVTVPAGATGGTTTIANVGTLTIKENGDFSFAPVTHFNGNVPTITYTVEDGASATNSTASSTLTIQVTPVNDPPLATPSTANGIVNDAFIPISLIGTDTESPSTQLTTSIIAPPLTQGKVTLADGTPVLTGTPLNYAQASTLKFVPAIDFAGTVNIDFTVKDPSGAVSSVATSVITIVSNDPPVATPFAVTVPEDTLSVPVSLVGTDTETPTADLTTRVLGLPTATEGVLTLSDGTLVVAGDSLTNAQASALKFLPASNFNGVVAIPFSVSDSSGKAVSASAVITVTPVNDAPTAVDDNYTMPEDGTAITLTPLTTGLDTDPENDTLTVNNINGTPIVAGTPVSIPVTGGTIAVDAAGVISFTPTPNFNGTVTVPYTITDGNGGTATANITINVTPVNDAPTAVDDNYTTAEDTPVTLTPLITGADSDPENNPLTVTSINGTPIVLGSSTTISVAGGKVTVDTTGNMTFSPSPNFFGTVTIPYVISDGRGGTATANQIITVTPVNDAPTATGSKISTFEDIAVTIGLSGTDVDGSITGIKIMDLPTADQGLTSLNGVPVAIGDVLTPADAASLVFTPASKFSGIVTPITFSVIDNDGLESSPASIQITVASKDTALPEQLVSAPMQLPQNVSPTPFTPFVAQTAEMLINVSTPRTSSMPFDPYGLPYTDSQKVIAQAEYIEALGNAFVDNVDTMGSSIGLFVIYAVRGLPITFDPDIHVQIAVWQSQLESMARSLGINNINTGQSAVITLLDQFSKGAPQEVDLNVNQLNFTAETKQSEWHQENVALSATSQERTHGLTKSLTINQLTESSKHPTLLRPTPTSGLKHSIEQRASIGFSSQIRVSALDAKTKVKFR